MDPVEELLLTELDDAFISRVSFREATTFTDLVEDLLFTGLDDSFISRVSFREAVANSTE